jgi:hypothetical protein
MHEVTSHAVGILNEKLSIIATGGKGPGGAYLEYDIILPPECEGVLGPHLTFQNGDPNVKVNGITGECLIAIAIDRLAGFQTGPFQCRENAIAITHLETALLWIQKRQRERAVRGVEGKQER